MNIHKSWWFRNTIPVRKDIYFPWLKLSWLISLSLSPIHYICKVQDLLSNKGNLWRYIQFMFKNETTGKAEVEVLEVLTENNPSPPKYKIMMCWYQQHNNDRDISASKANMENMATWTFWILTKLRVAFMCKLKKTLFIKCMIYVFKVGLCSNGQDTNKGTMTQHFHILTHYLISLFKGKTCHNLIVRTSVLAKDCITLL